MPSPASQTRVRLQSVGCHGWGASRWAVVVDEALPAVRQQRRRDNV